MPQNKNRRRDLNHTFIGEPGYRTREGRSGLDPVDTYREEAFLEGKFLQRLFTLKLRTRNRFYLVLMLFFGLGLSVLITPVVVFMLTSWHIRNFEYLLVAILFFGVTGLYLAIGIFLLVNFAINIRRMVTGEQDADDQSHKRPKERKKKLPRRRKDYR